MLQIGAIEFGRYTPRMDMYSDKGNATQSTKEGSKRQEENKGRFLGLNGYDKEKGLKLYKGRLGILGLSRRL